MTEVRGFKEVEENIKKVFTQLEPDVIEGVLLKGANILGQATINNAPVGPTGNLKRSIVAKLLPRLRGGQPATAIVAPDYKIAPHAGLVEFGHIAWRGGPSRKGKGYSIGFVPPHPFMRPAWDTYGESVKDAIVEDLKTKIEDAPG